MTDAPAPLGALPILRTRNAVSLRVLERLGFRREGTLRERWWVGGVVSDTAFLGLLAPEWRERR